MCFRYVYCDGEEAFLEYFGLFEKVEVWWKELVEGRLVEGDWQFYDRYFVVGVDLSGGWCVGVCVEVVLEFKVSVVGFFVLLSSDVAVEVYRVCWEKGVVEGGFDVLENGFDLHCLCVCSVEVIGGRLFVVFIFQVLSFVVCKVMSVSMLDEWHILSELLNELKSIYSVCLEGQRKIIYSELSKVQREIFVAFNVDEKPYV